MAIYIWPYPYVRLSNDSIKKNDILEENLAKLKSDTKENKSEIVQTKENRINITSITHNNVENTPIPIMSLTEDIVALISILLAQFTVQITHAFFIDIPAFILQVKQILNKVKIIKCILLQNTNVLFIKGVIEKEIIFTTMYSCFSFSGKKLRYHTVNIPFQCYTPIIYNGREPLSLVYNTSTLKGEPKDGHLGVNTKYQVVNFEFFNPKPYCELEYSKIVENIHIDKKKPWINEIPHTRIELKQVLYLNFILLQKQGLIIPHCKVKNKKTK